MKLRELLKKLRLGPSKQGEAERLVDSKEEAWATGVPSQQDERPH